MQGNLDFHQFSSTLSQVHIIPIRNTVAFLLRVARLEYDLDNKTADYAFIYSLNCCSISAGGSRLRRVAGKRTREHLFQSPRVIVAV